MLEAVLTHLKNWFVVPRGVHEGIYTIENGSLKLPFLQNGQYYRICGSVFNEETFTGTVWALAIPKAIVELSAKIEEWQTKNGDAVASPYSSESFGGYSYTKATDSATGATATWETVFRSQLNPYRKQREYATVKPYGGRYESD